MNDETEIKQLRNFGLTVGGIFGLIGFWPALLRSEPQLWAVIVASILIIAALLLPRILRPVYSLWMHVGHVLGNINTMIILSVIFYGLITPMGLVRRFLFAKDPMHRKFEQNAHTYRVMRQSRPGSHIKRQF